jgi:hypothetical protein
VVTFLARVSDANGRAGAVVSQHFELRGPAAPDARLVFERGVSVPDGSVRVEVVVYDHASRRATLVHRSLQTP